MTHGPDQPFGCPKMWGPPTGVFAGDMLLHVCNLAREHVGAHLCKCGERLPRRAELPPSPPPSPDPDVCSVCQGRRTCPACGALLGDHDLDKHDEWRTSNPTRAAMSPQEGSWQAEIGRLLRVNERQRVELRDALDREEALRRSVVTIPSKVKP